MRACFLAMGLMLVACGDLPECERVDHESLTLQCAPELDPYGQRSVVIDSGQAWETTCPGEVPPVDFAVRTIIGYLAAADGCHFEIGDQQVCRDDAAKSLTYQVAVDGSGNCEMTWQRLMWVSIPKAPEGYTFAFESH